MVQKEYPKFLLLSENPTKNHVNKILLFIFQNDMGLKPHDCAKVMGQKECAEFLLLYETLLEISWPFLVKFCRVAGTQHIPLNP